MILFLLKFKYYDIPCAQGTRMVPQCAQIQNRMRVYRYIKTYFVRVFKSTQHSNTKRVNIQTLKMRQWQHSAHLLMIGNMLVLCSAVYTMFLQQINFVFNKSRLCGIFYFLSEHETAVGLFIWYPKETLAKEARIFFFFCNRLFKYLCVVCL